MWVIGAATSVFGELWHISPRELATGVVREALRDARVSRDSIDALFVGNMLSGMLGGQEHLGAFFSDELGLYCPSFKVEGACASGGLAMHAGFMALKSGLYETVVVLGVEKMTDHKPMEVARALMGAGSSQERESGLTFPGVYALLAHAHMRAFGTTEQQMGAVAVKNHFHAQFNPNAQFKRSITVEEIMVSSVVADPLKLLDCSPISDGASAVVITNNPRYCKKQRIAIVSSVVANDTLGVAERSSLEELKATREAAQHAYHQAGVDPRDIDVAEVHDCFTIAEILAMEDLGFFPKGEAAHAIAEGKTTLGSSQKLVVNPSGGLKGCGHPVGATGVKQIVEIVDQLRGTAGKRQIDHAQVGLTQNVGGSGATAVVHILKAEGTV